MDNKEHGRHIAAMKIGAFNVICPQLIDSGRIYLAIPPYYGLIPNKERARTKEKKDKIFYLQTHSDVITYLAKHAYRPSFDIDIVIRDGLGNKVKEARLEGTAYEHFCHSIMALGEMLDNVANELVIDPIVLECLTYVTQYLTPETMNVDVIKERLGADKIIYTPHDNILTIAIGARDYSIPLHNVAEKLYQQVLPKLQKFMWKNTEVYITYKNYGDGQPMPMTMIQLYWIMKSYLDEYFLVKKYKGLGSMPPEDRYRTCMDPQYRTIYQITSMDDVNMVYNLLGGNSDYRKELLTRQPI